jgi:hypothetical protein
VAGLWRGLLMNDGVMNGSWYPYTSVSAASAPPTGRSDLPSRALRIVERSLRTRLALGGGPLNRRTAKMCGRTLFSFTLLPPAGRGSEPSVYSEPITKEIRLRSESMSAPPSTRTGAVIAIFVCCRFLPKM